MELFGFIVLCVILVKVTIVAFFLGCLHLGEYNLGGSPNSVGVKILTILSWVAVAYAWYAVFSNSPIAISLK